VQLYDDVGDSLKQDGVSKLKVGTKIQLKSDDYQLMRENAIKTMKVKSNGSTSDGLTWALTGKDTFLKNNEVTYTGTDADTPADAPADAAGGCLV
jgi:hypothetical protein